MNHMLGVATLQKRKLSAEWLSEISYSEGLEIQHRAANHVNRTGNGRVLGLEHTPVITLGRRVKDQNSEVIHLPPGFTLEFTDRGGEATMHAPGQLVVYPVLPVRSWELGVRQYVDALESALIETLAQYEIRGEKVDGDAGVFTDAGKIAFIGIRVANGVSTHGLALNVKNDLSAFQSIRSCGRWNRPLDSMELHGITATPQEVFAVFCAKLAEVLGLTFSEL